MIRLIGGGIVRWRWVAIVLTKREVGNADRRDMRCWITSSRSQLYANIEVPHQGDVCTVLYSWRTTANLLITKWNPRVTKNLAVLGTLLAPICTCFVILDAASEGYMCFLESSFFPTICPSTDNTRWSKFRDYALNIIRNNVRGELPGTRLEIK